MIETIGFNMERFKFHLKLYIRYSDLQNASRKGNIGYNILGYGFTDTINILKKKSN